MSARSAEEARAILAARAVELARPIEDESAGEEIEVVRFVRGGESYAVESRYIQEVFPLGAVALLPGVGAPVAGATAWRGGILVLLEPGAQGDASEAAAVVAVGETRAEFGLLADEMVELERIPVAAIGPAGGGVASGRAGLRGVTREGVLVLDGGELIKLRTQRSIG